MNITTTPKKSPTVYAQLARAMTAYIRSLPADERGRFFVTDVTTHDRAWVERYPGKAFTWVLYRGCSYLSASISRDMLRSLAEEGASRFFECDGTTIRRTTAEEIEARLLEARRGAR